MFPLHSSMEGFFCRHTRKRVRLYFYEEKYIFTTTNCFNRFHSGFLQAESYVSIPKKYHGTWVVFNGTVTDNYFEIDNTSIKVWKSNEPFVKDICLNFPGVKERTFDATTYKPVQSVAGYEPAYSIGYEQSFNDRTIWIMYNPDSDALKFIELDGIDNKIKYKYHLIRR